MLSIRVLFRVLGVIGLCIGCLYAQPLGSPGDTDPLSKKGSFDGRKILQSIRPSIDLGLRTTTLTDSTTEAQARLEKLSGGGFVSLIGVGAFVPLLQTQNQYALGIQTGLQVGGTPFAERLNLRVRRFIISAPIFLAAKLGPSASRMSVSTYGGAIGLGGVWVRQGTTGLANGLNHTTSAFVPAVFGEVTVGSGQVIKQIPKSQITIRVTAHLSEATVSSPAKPQDRNYLTSTARMGYYAACISLGW